MHSLAEAKMKVVTFQLESIRQQDVVQWPAPRVRFLIVVPVRHPYPTVFPRFAPHFVGDDVSPVQSLVRAPLQCHVAADVREYSAELIWVVPRYVERADRPRRSARNGAGIRVRPQPVRLFYFRQK